MMRRLTRAELATPGNLSQAERVSYVRDLAVYWGLDLDETKRRVFDLYLIDEGRLGKDDRN